MRYYAYSVKNELIDYFGDETVFEMRKQYNSWFDENDYEEKDIKALCWQYADESVLGLFLDERFLISTEILDDYIAYKLKKGTRNIVFLMFMITEEELPFTFDANYAKNLSDKWLENGYEPYIVSECIYVEKSEKGRLHFGTHNIAGGGTTIQKVGMYRNKPILEYTSESCWEFFDKKIISVVESKSTEEYACLFDDDICVTEGEKDSKRTICKGIEGLKLFFENVGLLKIGYIDTLNNGVYSKVLCSDEWIFSLFVNRRNLISEIEVKPLKDNCQMFDEKIPQYGSLVEKVPFLEEAVLLPVDMMHGIVLQLKYEKNLIKNYYLFMFDTYEIPQTIMLGDKEFGVKDFESYKVNEKGVAFDNGYVIDKCRLYYKSYRQVNIEYPEDVIYENEDVKIEALYRVPLKQFMSHFSIKQYRGFEDECYGPNEPIIDTEGKRYSYVAAFNVSKDNYSKGISEIRVEPTAKYGYMNQDGSWFIPPIYDKLKVMWNGFVEAQRKVDGKECTFLINEKGNEFSLPYQVNIADASGGLIPFNEKKWIGLAPYPGNFDNLQAGNWGFMDIKGNVIVKPQYIYATGFEDAGEKHAIVARYDNGGLLWGVIDTSGKEIVPCGDRILYSKWWDAISFREKDEFLLGLMDFDGNIIMEPKFEYIGEYDSERGLLQVGEDKDHIGLYSIMEDRLIIPMEYDCIDLKKHIIECEMPYTIKMKYFDYDGNEILFDEYDRVFEKNDRLGGWKDGKYGEISFSGKEIIPPILPNGLDDCIELYRNGYLITGENKQKGLSTVTGKVIVPETYSELLFYEPFIVASERINNWCIKDSLLLFSGEVVVQGPYRHMRFDEKKSLFSLENPEGHVFYKVVKKK